MTAIVSIGGIHLVNSTGAPVAGGAATAAATTPFTIRGNWRPAVAEPISIQGDPFSYPDVYYSPVQETIPIAIFGSTHENAVARKQELERVLAAANDIPAVLSVQPTASSNAVHYEITNAVIRLVQEDGSGFESWEGFSEIHAELTCMRSPHGGRGAGEGAVSLTAGTVTNTGTGANPNVRAYPAGLDGDLANEGQPTRVLFLPVGTGNFTIFYFAAIYSRTYSTTGSGAKTTSSTTGATAALNAVSIVAARAAVGLKARAIFRFTNCTANARVRVEMRASTVGTVLYAGPWVTPTAGVATLYDMGRVPLDSFLRVPDNADTMQLYIGYKSSDGASATATLGYNEFLLYYDFCKIESPTAITAAGGASGYGLSLISYKQSTAGRPYLPFTPLAFAYDNSNSTILDTAPIRGRPPRAIEGGSIYAAWMTAGHVHDTAKVATLSISHAPLWKNLRGAD